MKAFGFLSFVHYAFGGQRGPSAEKSPRLIWRSPRLRTKSA